MIKVYGVYLVTEYVWKGGWVGTEKDVNVVI